MAQNDKKFCLLHFISQEPYIIWFSFMVHMYEMIISTGVFFIISKFWFSGLLEGKRAKNSPKWQNIWSVALYISGTIHHLIVIYGTHVQNDIISRMSFHFFKILIFLVKGIKGQTTVQNDKKLFLLHFVSQEPYIIWLSCVSDTQV